VRIERRFDALAEDVFDAWTSPEATGRWFHCAPDWDTPETKVDFRVGGMFWVVMRRPDGTEALTDMERRLSFVNGGNDEFHVLALVSGGVGVWSAGWVAVRQAVRDARSD
jgi:uncharacterized protein YndB with AHSA1/START domain